MGSRLRASPTSGLAGQSFYVPRWHSSASLKFVLPVTKTEFSACPIAMMICISQKGKSVYHTRPECSLSGFPTKKQKIPEFLLNSSILG
jgi:hypothetical protein